MLEIPESHTESKQLRETVQGKTIESVVAAQSPHGFAWYCGDPAEYNAILAGKKITDVYPLAGQIEICADDMRLVLNDGINLRLFAPGEKLPAKHQLHITFDSGESLVCTVMMYGGMCAFPAGTKDDEFYYSVAKNKPSPLGDAFDEPYFDSIVKEAPAKLSAKGLLATEQRIPGLGNGVLHDILLNARTHPKTKVAKLTDADLGDIYNSVKSTLHEMTAGGGRDTEKDLFGNPGGYKTKLSAKTYHFPCIECGGPVTRQAYMGGNIYFCPSCQELKT